MTTYFITGIGTDVGKTLIATIIAEALQADYWKPVQAGYENGTDSQWVKKMMTNKKSSVHREIYKLKLAASPHIAAAEEGVEISIDKIVDEKPATTNTLLIEGAGGLMVPFNKNEFVIDLIKKLGATVIIISKNYLGSINHSLLTARILKQNKVDVLGWIFNGNYLDYENEIVQWSGFPWIASVRNLPEINKGVIHTQAVKIREHLNLFL
ncbi:MAG: dethiobiotin synthase [Ginsengibacter sp.]